MTVCTERGRETLYVACVYIPTDSTSVFWWMFVMIGLR